MARLYRSLLTLVLVTLSLLSCHGTEAGDESWTYDDLDYVLEQHVSAEGRVDYAGLVGDSTRLERFVEALGRVSPDSHAGLFPTRDDRLAYWINAYNALMLKRVVDAWPIDSIKQIKPAFGVFWLESHRLGGKSFSLRKLENRIIRRRFKEPRIHFAINCASAGCPALRNRAWRPETLEADLEDAAAAFMRDPRNVQIDREQGAVRLSSIFKWFEGDFTMSPQIPELLDYVARYHPELQGRDPGDPLRVEWVDYDWSLNGLVTCH